MKRPPKLLCFAAAFIMALLLTVIPASADTGESTLQISGEPAKLIIQLGPGWAGTQFELRTDAGMYPGTVVVSETGLLQMDLGGSKTFTLSRVQGAAKPGNSPAAQEATSVSAADTPSAAADTTPDIAATTDPDVNLDAFLAALTEPGTEVPAEQSTQQEEQAPEGVPIKHILIFGGGIVAAIIALIVMASLKKRRVDGDEEDDYED
jgi:hypothetical protein